MKNLLTVLLIIVIVKSSLASADPCNRTISGTVIDSVTNEIIPFALITLKGLNKGIYSDSKGHFHIDSLCEDTYTISCRILGYEETSRTLKLNRSSKITFLLAQKNIELKEVSIETDRVKHEIIQTQSSITGQALDQTRGNTLAESLTGISGVTTIKTGPSISKPVIHGMHSNRILILNNGVRQEGQQWGSEHAPEIDPFIASELTVMKGAASIKYGSDAIAGVVVVNPKSLKKEHGYQAELNLIGLSNNRQGVVSGILDGNLRGIEGLAFRLQGTYKRAGNSFAPSYNLGNTGFKEYNFSGTVGYTRHNFEGSVFYSQFNNTLGILSKSHKGNKTDLLDEIRDNKKDTADFTYKIDRPRQEVGHRLLKVNGKIYTDHGLFNLTYAYQHNAREEFDAHKRSSASQLQFDLHTNTLDLNWEHKVGDRIKGSLGTNGMMQANIYTGRKLIPNFTSYTGGVYLIEKYSKQNFQLEGGIRYDYKWLKSYENLRNTVSTNQLNWSNISGTAGATVNLSNQFRIQGTIGSAWRAPSINELFIDGLHHGTGTVEKGDANLEVEQACNFNTSFKYNTGRLSAEVDVYYNLINNYIYLKPDTAVELTSAGAFPKFNYTQVDAAFYGIDSDIHFNVTRAIQLSSKVALVRAVNRNSDRKIVGIPPDRFIHSINIKPGDVSQLKDITFGISNLSVLKQTRVDQNSDYAAPPAGYSLFNSDLSFYFVMKGLRINMGLSVNNIFNTKYRDYLNAFRYYVDEPGRNFILRMKIPIQISN